MPGRKPIVANGGGMLKGEGRLTQHISSYRWEIVGGRRLLTWASLSLLLLRSKPKFAKLLPLGFEPTMCIMF